MPNKISKDHRFYQETVKSEWYLHPVGHCTCTNWHFLVNKGRCGFLYHIHSPCNLLKTTLDYKTAWFGPKGQFSVLNDLCFKTTCNTRPHFVVPLDGLKIEGPLYTCTWCMCIYVQLGCIATGRQALLLKVLDAHPSPYIHALHF